MFFRGAKEQNKDINKGVMYDIIFKCEADIVLKKTTANLTGRIFNDLLKISKSLRTRFVKT